MNQIQKVIDHLLAWREELAKRSTFSTIEEKAEHIGLMNSVEVAVSQLKLCEKYGVNPGSWFCVFPEIYRSDHQPEYRVVNDGESDNPTDWEEVEFERRGKVYFHGGDVVIKR